MAYSESLYPSTHCLHSSILNPWHLHPPTHTFHLHHPTPTLHPEGAVILVGAHHPRNLQELSVAYKVVGFVRKEGLVPLPRVDHWAEEERLVVPQLFYEEGGSICGSCLL